MQTLELTHFDGTTLLGFLASVGALRLLDAVGVEDVKLEFDPSRSNARLRGSGQLRTRMIEALLDEKLRENWVFSLGETIFNHPGEMPIDSVKPQLTGRLKPHPPLSKRFRVDTLSAVVADESDDGMAVSTEMRAVGGGQLQYFKQIAGLFSRLDLANVEATLDRQWSHEDEKGGLRLAPEEDRSYALRASDPSAEGAFGERAANVLALQGQTLLPTLPRSRGGTVGFDSKEKTFTWPLWHGFCGVGAVASLLTIAADTPRLALQGMGVFRLMSARRFTRGQYRNFSPALPIW